MQWISNKVFTIVTKPEVLLFIIGFAMTQYVWFDIIHGFDKLIILLLDQFSPLVRWQSWPLVTYLWHYLHAFLFGQLKHENNYYNQVHTVCTFNSRYELVNKLVSSHHHLLSKLFFSRWYQLVSYKLFSHYNFFVRLPSLLSKSGQQILLVCSCLCHIYSLLNRVC